MGQSPEGGQGDYFSDPDEVLKVIRFLNDRWREKLNYPGFELEPEYSDIMLFVKHKNYLIWNARDGKLHMSTKGNNFKGSDKAVDKDTFNIRPFKSDMF